MGAALIQGISDVVGAGLNFWSQAEANKGQHDLVTQMYAQQRKDALSDWNMQNEYNSPAAQMARYKAAGLNPNLIYGQSNISQPIRSSSVPSYNPTAPRVDLSGMVARYYNVQQMEKQLQILDAQRANIEADTKLKGTSANLNEANVPKVLTDTELSRFNLNKLNQLLPYDLQLAQQSVEKVKQDVKYSLNQQQINTLLANQTLKQGVQTLIQQQLDQAKTKQETDNLKIVEQNLIKEGKIKAFENQLNESGATKGDAAWLRMLLIYWDKIMKAINGE